MSGLTPWSATDDDTNALRLNVTEMLNKIWIEPRSKRDTNDVARWLRANDYVENMSTRKWKVIFQKVTKEVLKYKSKR